jgi:hypothetical protein
LKVGRGFRGTCRLHLWEGRISEQETSIKAGGKQRNWLAYILVYVRKLKGMEDSESVATGLSVGQNKLPLTIFCHPKTE